MAGRQPPEGPPVFVRTRLTWPLTLVPCQLPVSGTATPMPRGQSYCLASTWTITDVTHPHNRCYINALTPVKNPFFLPCPPTRPALPGAGAETRSASARTTPGSIWRSKPDSRSPPGQRHRSPNSRPQAAGWPVSGGSGGAIRWR